MESDGQTDGRTTLVVKSLSRLKIVVLMLHLAFSSIEMEYCLLLQDQYMVKLTSHGLPTVYN